MRQSDEFPGSTLLTRASLLATQPTGADAPLALASGKEILEAIREMKRDMADFKKRLEAMETLVQAVTDQRVMSSLVHGLVAATNQASQPKAARFTTAGPSTSTRPLPKINFVFATPHLASPSASSSATATSTEPFTVPVGHSPSATAPSPTVSPPLPASISSTSKQTWSGAEAPTPSARPSPSSSTRTFPTVAPPTIDLEYKDTGNGVKPPPAKRQRATAALPKPVAALNNIRDNMTKRRNAAVANRVKARAAFASKYPQYPALLKAFTTLSPMVPKTIPAWYAPHLYHDTEDTIRSWTFPVDLANATLSIHSPMITASAQFLGRLLDRWAEFEEGKRTPTLFSIPTTAKAKHRWLLAKALTLKEPVYDWMATVAHVKPEGDDVSLEAVENELNQLIASEPNLSKAVVRAKFDLKLDRQWLFGAET